MVNGTMRKDDNEVDHRTLRQRLYRNANLRLCIAFALVINGIVAVGILILGLQKKSPLFAKRDVSTNPVSWQSAFWAHSAGKAACSSSMSTKPGESSGKVPAS